MKYLAAILLMAMPAMAHPEEHYFEEVHRPSISADAFVTNTVNHGYINCYGQRNCFLTYDVDVATGRMIVPNGTQHFYRYPYSEAVTVW